MLVLAQIVAACIRSAGWLKWQQQSALTCTEEQPRRQGALQWQLYVPASLHWRVSLHHAAPRVDISTSIKSAKHI